ncbi:YgaP family membrane protein [Haloarcula brevis]|uniref:YgaP family membrane protein n=1 Tax=Haloarcula brevis TaxID=3111453 RepID=UPI00300E9077
MDSDTNVGGRDRLLRAVLAVVLTIVSVRWLRSGKRKRGLLAGVGALGLGFNASTGYCGFNDTFDIDTTSEPDDDDVFSPSDSDEEPATDDSADVSVDFAASDDAATTEVRANGTLTCAVCEDPIVPGERRGPNDEGAIVHESCE